MLCNIRFSEYTSSDLTIKFEFVTFSNYKLIFSSRHIILSLIIFPLPDLCIILLRLLFIRIISTIKSIEQDLFLILKNDLVKNAFS